MVVEAGLRCLGKLEVGIEGGTNKLRVSRGDYGLRGLACLNSFSSSMTCIPFSYCSLVGASPTFAKWPFIVITEGAVGNLEAVEGLLVPWPFVVEDIVEEERKRDTNNNLGRTLSCDVVCVRPLVLLQWMNWHLIQSHPNQKKGATVIWAGVDIAGPRSADKFT